MTLALADEVRDAMTHGLPVVALDPTIIAHGLPQPRNLTIALELEESVRAAGAVPATVAVLDGRPHIGLSESELERIATGEPPRKLSHRDLAPAMATGASGATTISGTAFLAAHAGIRVFATGGLGGVHRGWSRAQDESADLRLLARTRVTAVCAGVTSLLDVPATVERLETLGVALIGYGTATCPAYCLADSGVPVDWTVHDAREVAAAMRAQDTLGGPDTALVVAQPVRAADQLDPQLHDRVLTDALTACERDGVTGAAVTPYLLERLVRDTGGASLEASLSAVRENVRLAARVAAVWAATAHI
ncbi:pseudouridine-5'-phosphate glycosidase [Streptomyces oceani]|uniref:Pseudouridine-5'-phosphate glycosidase n=1 Tax=Streptomyces oceani TaxID=1075402 RepID=A0A1E7KIX3_9ACTN|nr:pseudouridine-5'-phosphate glycosidase [Streptomyces oceani]OEV03932.1 pseudouridine-5-phosphate glycosidase [Streptomyces oceani]